MGTNQMEKVAELLDVELGEEFVLCLEDGSIGQQRYKITTEGVKKFDGQWHLDTHLINHLLTGKFEIIKLNFFPKLGRPDYSLYFSETEEPRVSRKIWAGDVWDYTLFEFGMCYPREAVCRENLASDYKRLTGKEWSDNG